MKLLDLDMDYFMENIAIGITESREERLSEDEYYITGKIRYLLS